MDFQTLDYQTIAAVLFILFMVYFLLKNRNKIRIQKIAFPLLYFAMYRTKFGLNFMDGMAKRFPRLLKWTAYAGVFLGFTGMIFISYFLVSNLVKMVFLPGAAPGVGLVLPFKVKGSFYVPFFYWIISIFVLAVIHEFAHGTIARAYGVKIKSSGFAFLGIIAPILPAAFVEPDEKEMDRKSAGAKLSVFAAGPFANILFAAFIALLFFLLFTPLAETLLIPDGVLVKGYVKGADNETFPAELANITIGDTIIKVNGINVSYVENFTDVMNNTKPGQELTIETNVTTYTVTLAEDPQNANESYLGVYIDQNRKVSESFKEKYGNIVTSSLIWIIGLFFWFYVLNLGIGLFNLVPIGPIDGGRMLHVVLTKYLREDLAIKVWKLISALFLLIILIIILFAFTK